MKKATQSEMFSDLPKVEREPVVQTKTWNYQTAVKAWGRWLLIGENFPAMNEAVNWVFSELLRVRASNRYLKRKIKRLEERYGKEE